MPRGGAVRPTGRSAVLPVTVLLVSVVLSVAAIVLPGGQDEAAAAHPGRNGDIAFTREFAGESALYRVGADGTGLQRLPLTGTRPSWSPDGRRIAYCTDSDVGPFGEIRVADADGRRSKKLLSYMSRYGCDQPSWSPDRTRIAFTARRAIFTAAVTGGERRALTRPSSEFGSDPGSQQPAWSPRGDRIAWARYGRSGTIDIWTMKPDGSRKRRLTRSLDGTQASRPIWSPGGRWIMYTRFTSKEDTFDEEGVYVMKRDGTGKRRLENHERVAAWSPDGRLIATLGTASTGFMAYDGIWIAQLHGSGTRRLTDPLAGIPPTSFGPRAYDSDPDWQPLPR
jgi:Tol biopolymer transport system component